MFGIDLHSSVGYKSEFAPFSKLRINIGQRALWLNIKFSADGFGQLLQSEIVPLG